MMVCCPKCGETFFSMSAIKTARKIIYDPCEVCGGQGYHYTHTWEDQQSTASFSVGSIKTCEACQGTGKGEIAGFIE